MKLLAIDTATEACSAALFLDGDIRCAYEYAPRRHAELILSMVSGILDAAGVSLRDLDALAFGRGPGSFTGLRIAAGVAQGLAFGADLPVVRVSSLQALAQGARREVGAQHVLSAIDARMGEVYWCPFRLDRGLMIPSGDERVSPPGEVELPAEADKWFGAGSGFAGYRELHEAVGPGLSDFDAERLPHARDVAILGVAAFERGEAVAAEQAIPVYLRDRVARKPAEAAR